MTFDAFLPHVPQSGGRNVDVIPSAYCPCHIYILILFSFDILLVSILWNRLDCLIFNDVTFLLAYLMPFIALSLHNWTGCIISFAYSSNETLSSTLFLRCQFS